MSPSELFQRVVTVAPGFDAVLKEHIKDNNELLPHVLMADLLRYVGRKLSTKESLSEVKAILSLLELALGSRNPETENAIAVSFIEHITTEPFYPALQPMFGPRMRAEHEAQSAG